MTHSQDPLSFTRHPTPWLRSFAATQRSALAEKDFDEMLGLVRGIHAKYCAALMASAPGPDRAEALHRMMDRATATAHELRPSCKLGCSGCCHFEVEITPDEASMLAECVKEGVEVDKTRLDKQAERPRLSPEWGRFFDSDNRCVFLNEDGACRVYERRPAACRRLLVTTPPEYCTTVDAPVAPVGILLAELALNAAVDVSEGTHAALARLLKKELNGQSGLSSA